jgi:hypothetical protein
MHTIQLSGTTDPDGTLTLRVPVGQPDTEFEAVVVVQPKTSANGTPTPRPATDPWAAIDAFRERLAASGRDFGDSVQDIREDRDR